MSTLKNPVGPQPASVYWRRRLVVGLGLLAVILVVVLIIVRPGSGTPAPTPSPSPSAAAGTDAAPNPDASAGAEAGSTDAGGASGEVACDPAKLTLDPVTDATEYQAGVTPQLWFTVKSTMAEPCTLAVGSDVQEYRVTSGEELIWSSRDCQTDPVAATTVLQPGVPKEGPHITWDRTRSSTDTCGTPRDPVTADGASYHLEVSIGDVDSTATRQFLLY